MVIFTQNFIYSSLLLLSITFFGIIVTQFLIIGTRSIINCLLGSFSVALWVFYQIRLIPRSVIFTCRVRIFIIGPWISSICSIWFIFWIGISLLIWLRHDVAETKKVDNCNTIKMIKPYLQKISNLWTNPFIIIYFDK